MIRTCPFCDANNSALPSLGYSVNSWALKQCNSCGLVYLENPPGYSALESEFAWEKTSQVERQRRKSLEPVFQAVAACLGHFRHKVLKRDKLAPLVRRFFCRGAVIDLGCSAGGSFHRLGKLGFVPYGVEVSATLAREAAARASANGGRVVAANALDGLDQFVDRTFSGAILISYLEHDINPLPILKKLSQKLIAGGRLIIKVPNFGCWNRRVRGSRWCGFRFPDHVNYFTPATLRAIIRKAGFQILRFSLRDRFPLSDTMWMVCQTAGPVTTKTKHILL